ncbi:MAG: HEPN domain-containing protein [Labilithrix sp.]|nr:HEPN domain-containing protein [Labilithrix sp.]MCW5814934.1 HEPN domain-containing protein [Labilithrix sp.]
MALIGLGLGRDAVSRAYYAAFHAACALLAQLGEQARTHRGVQRLLSTRVVATGRMDAAHLRTFQALQERRNIADYSVADVAPEEASVLVESARVFVEAARSLVSSD